MLLYKKMRFQTVQCLLKLFQTIQYIQFLLNKQSMFVVFSFKLLNIIMFVCVVLAVSMFVLQCFSYKCVVCNVYIMLCCLLALIVKKPSLIMPT